MEAQLERLNKEIEALASQIEAALAIAQQPGASPLAAKHYDNLVAKEKQLIASRDALQVQLEIEALAPQIEAALAIALQPGASPLAAKHYDNLVAEKKQLIASKDALQVELLSGTLRKVLKEYLSEQQERISVTMSKASGARLMEVAKRLGSPLQRGLLFTTHKPFLQPKQKFKWPRSGDAEDEVAGYSDAITFISDHICKGQDFVAVLKYQDARLQLIAPDQHVQIKPGATDVLLVLPEYKEDVERDTSAEAHILTIVGQMELKTEKAMERAEQCLAQAGMQHLSATFLLMRALLASDCNLPHAFVSVCTDLVAGWGMFSNRDQQLCLTEKAESPAGQGFPKFTCSAILDVRNALAKSAATLRKIRKAIAAGPLVSAGGVSGEGGEGNGGSGSNNEASDSRGNDAGNTQPNSDPAASQQAALGSSAPKAVSNSKPALRSKQRSAASLDDCVLQRMLGDDEGLREVEALHSVAVVNLLRSDLGYRGLLGRTEAPKSIQHPTLSELWQHPLSQHAQLVRDTMDAALQEEPASGVDAAAGEA